MRVQPVEDVFEVVIPSLFCLELSTYPRPSPLMQLLQTFAARLRERAVSVSQPLPQHPQRQWPSRTLLIYLVVLGLVCI